MGDDDSKVYFPTANSSQPTPTGNNKFNNDDWNTTSANLTWAIPMFQPTSDGTDITTSGLCAGKHCPFYDDPTVMFPDETDGVCRCADVLRYGQTYSLLMSTGTNEYPTKKSSSGQSLDMFWLNYVEPTAYGELSNVGQGGSVNVTPLVSGGTANPINTACNQTILDFITTDNGVNQPPRYAYFTFHSPIFPDGTPIKSGPQHAFYVMQHPGSNAASTTMANISGPTVWGTKFAQSDVTLDESDSANYRYYNWVCAQSYDAIPWNKGLSTSGAGLANTSCFQRNSTPVGGESATRTDDSNNADFNGGGQWPPLFYFDVMWVIPNLDDISKGSGNFSSDTGTMTTTAMNTTQTITDMSHNHVIYNRQRFSKSPNKFPEQQPYVMTTLPYAIRSTVGWWIHFGSSHNNDCNNVPDTSFEVNAGTNPSGYQQRLDTWATNCTANGITNNVGGSPITTYVPFSVFQAIPYKITQEQDDQFEPDTIFLGLAVSNTCTSDKECNTNCDGTTCAVFENTSDVAVDQKCTPTGYWGTTATTSTADYFSTQKFCAPLKTKANWDEFTNNGNTGKVMTQTDMLILGFIGLLLLLIVGLVVYWFILSRQTSTIEKHKTASQLQLLSGKPQTPQHQPLQPQTPQPSATDTPVSDDLLNTMQSSNNIDYL